MRYAADVIVIGCGAGGAAAALGARKAGASVLVLERQTAGLHTPSLRMSGGWVMTMMSAVTGAAYLKGCSGGLVDDATLAAWAERAVGLEVWMAEMGVRLTGPEHRAGGGEVVEAEQPHIDGAETVRIGRSSTELPSPHGGRGGLTIADGEVIGGEAAYRGVMHAMAKAGVGIRWDARVASLSRNGDRIDGVRLRSGEHLRARRGVVVAAGGFGADEDFIRQFLPIPNTAFYGNPDNDGSGIRMAMAAGAGLARMNRMVGRGVFAARLEDGRKLAFMVDLGGGGYAICDQLGKRFANEHEQATQSHSFYYRMQDFEPHRAAYLRSPCYYIFDHRRFAAGPIAYPERGVCGVGLYDWSADNARELAAGWIGRGDTPAEAAQAAGAAKGGAFDAEIAAYNAICDSGRDPFGRPAASLVPLANPPFYCMPLVVGGPYPHGGPQRDALGRILTADTAQPIPGLYGAGEAGQAVGVLYPARGASISEAFCLGAIAGESAALAK